MHRVEEKLLPELKELGGPLLLAVSGGPDSVALLRATLSVRRSDELSLVVGHFNHRLRADSDDDEHFVVELCRQLGVVCHVGRSEKNLREETAGVGLEAAARNARYDFLELVAAQSGVSVILTAHTANDQAETVMHRILRGTGLRGLKGIQRVRKLTDGRRVIRPFLRVFRDEVLDYLATLGQAVRHDPTNVQNRQTRNRIRNQLLPLLLREYNPEIVASLLRLGDTAREIEELISQLVRALIDGAVHFADVNAVEINITAAQAAAPYVVRQLLVEIWHRQHWPQREMDHGQWATLEQMIFEGHPASRSLPGGVRAQRKGEQLLLTRPWQSLD
jgi:tRNA(Ile)-lysidine synthase